MISTFYVNLIKINRNLIGLDEVFCFVFVILFPFNRNILKNQVTSILSFVFECKSILFVKYVHEFWNEEAHISDKIIQKHSKPFYNVNM